jgi:hypothetical protein
MLHDARDLGVRVDRSTAWPFLLTMLPIVNHGARDLGVRVDFATLPLPGHFYLHVPIVNHVGIPELPGPSLGNSLRAIHDHDPRFCVYLIPT